MSTFGSPKRGQARWSARCSPVARSELEPFLGLLTGTICGFTSAGSCATLLCGNFLTPPGLSQGVLLSEVRARAERVGCLSQSRCHALRSLPRVTYRALSVALAVGGLASGRGLLSATSGFFTLLALLEPGKALSLSLRLPLISGFLTLIG